jgi:hypothetical protein
LTDRLPEPLTPADCDLRDFAFMPLDVVRLRDSDLAATETAEAFRAAVLLWCASWHQLPAASLPDDDRVLANLAGYGRVVKEWQKEREGALRGWVKCEDGRLYHPVVAEKARDSWRGKLEQRWRTEAARLKKHNQRHHLEGDAALQMPDFEVWLSQGRPQGQALPVPGDRNELSQGQPGDRPQLVPGETASKGKGERQGQGKGQGTKRKGAKAPLSADDLPTWMHALVRLYHEVLPELPGVRVMDADRKRTLSDFWEWVLHSKRPDGSPRATSEEEALTWARDYFERARHNDFIMGRGHRSPEHQNWRCSIEYLLSSRGIKKVVEETEAPLEATT